MGSEKCQKSVTNKKTVFFEWTLLYVKLKFSCTYISIDSYFSLAHIAIEILKRLICLFQTTGLRHRNVSKRIEDFGKFDFNLSARQMTISTPIL